MALGGVVIDNGGLVWPGNRGCAKGELAFVETVEVTMKRAHWLSICDGARWRRLPQPRRDK